MKYAADVLGVETRKMGSGGKKNLWRSVDEVRQDCKEQEARLCPSPHASAGSSSSQRAPPAEPEQAMDEVRLDCQEQEARLCQSPHDTAGTSSSQRATPAGPEQARLSQPPPVSARRRHRQQELRQECLRAGIATTKRGLGYNKKGCANPVHLPNEELEKKLAAHKKSLLDKYFSRRPGAAPVESDKAPLVSGFAKTTGRIALHPRRSFTKARQADERRSRATPIQKKATRKRMATPRAQERNAQQKAARREMTTAAEGQRALQARAQRQREAVTSEGTWAITARQMAAAQGSPATPSMLPPAFAALHNEGCLAFVSEMYEALDLAQWQTCVVCWRAWYDVPRNYKFKRPSGTLRRGRTWFNFYGSSVLRGTRRKDVGHWFIQGDERAGSAAQAVAFLRSNYDEVTCQRLLDRLVDRRLKRGVVICSACAPHVEDDQLCAPCGVRLCDYVVDPLCSQDGDQALPVLSERWHVHVDDDGEEQQGLHNAARTTPVLGLALQDFAAPVAQLTDQEEMVLSLIHQLVQVYTLPRTGQLAYVGHVCNFR